MNKRNSEKSRSSLVFHRFKRKGYSIFASLGREVLIGTLSVTTLTYAKADSISIAPLRSDSVTMSAERVLDLEELSVVGTRAPLAGNKAARMVTVLGRAEIAAAPVQSVNDLVKYAAGVDVRQRGAMGAQTDVSVRGGNYEQIAVLLNGINICDPQTGHNSFDFPVDISEIERIEVLEGPAGRVYGTSSLLGAINIVTKTPATSSVDAHVEGGSYGYLSGGARANVAQGAWNNQISGSYTRSDGFSRNKQGGLNADFGSAKAFYQGNYSDSNIAVKWHAGMSLKNFGSNTFYGSKWDDQFEHTLKTFTAVQAETRQGRLRLRPAIYWNRSMDRFELFRGSETAVPYNYHRSDVFGANINGYFDWLLGRTAVGAEIRNEDLVSTNLGEPLDEPQAIGGTDREYKCGLNRTNISLVLEHNVVLDRFTLSAGLVAVKNSWNNMNMRVYPGADASFRFAKGWSIYASYNTSLRMPSATELYYSVGGHKADKYLKPEELSAWEAGVKYLGGGITASANVYFNHCKNMIDWIRDTAEGADAVWQSVNFTTVDAVGAEASVALDIKRLLPQQRVLRNVSLSYSYIDQNKKDVEGLESRYVLEYLRHKLVARLDMNLWRRLDLAAIYRYHDRVGNYIDIDGNAAVYSPYGIVDARLSWNAPKYRLYVEVNNLLNKTYVDYGNVPQPGTWLTAGLAITLK